MLHSSRRRAGVVRPSFMGYRKWSSQHQQCCYEMDCGSFCFPAGKYILLTIIPGPRLYLSDIERTWSMKMAVNRKLLSFLLISLVSFSGVGNAHSTYDNPDQDPITSSSTPLEELEAKWGTDVSRLLLFLSFMCSYSSSVGFLGNIYICPPEAR